MISRTRLVIFDFDGVLANSEDVHWDAFAQVLREEGVEMPRAEYYRSYLGLTDGACLAAAFASQGRHPGEAEIEALVQRKRDAFASRSGAVQLFPGVADLLRALHPRHLLAVASGAFHDEIESVLQRGHVLELFTEIVAAEDVTHGKPAPEPFLSALACVNRARCAPLTPAQCLVVEDAPYGIEAAHAAGMRCVAVATSHTREALAGADAVLDDIGRLAAAAELLA